MRRNLIFVRNIKYDEYTNYINLCTWGPSNKASFNIFLPTQKLKTFCYPKKKRIKYRKSIDNLTHDIASQL